MDSAVRAAATACLAAALVFTSSCGASSPAVPTQPSPAPSTPAPAGPTIASVQVGVAGNAPTDVAPGDRLQLFAQAVSTDGTTTDVTNLAVWQSSNPVVATVAPTGVMTAAAEGILDVTATYQARSGSIHAEVKTPGCAATVSPSRLVFGALFTGGNVTVTTTRSDCRWTARSDASWLPLTYDPGRSGSGNFSYPVPDNNTPDPRDANIIVSVSGGASVVHSIHQERPIGCVYTVSPTQLTFAAAGGKGSVQVTTLPGDCQWQINEDLGFYGITFTSAKSGTGPATVTYTVKPNVFSSEFDTPFYVRGLSGLNPPATHRIHVLR